MRNFFCLLLLMFFATGCGEIAYKQGASAKDLEATKKLCQTKTNDAAIEKCLEDHGWMVQKLADIGLPDSDLFATASVAEDNRGMTKPGKQADKLASQEVLKETEKTGTSKNIEGSKSPEPTATVATVNEFDTYRINSWWKMGAGPTALESDINGCTEKLGAAHQPDRKAQVFSRGFIVCMYNKGWRGLREK